MNIEIIGAVLGLVFLYLEIKENKWLWPVGLFTSAMYIYVFLEAKLYADMSLQIYYVFISIYGWILWSRGVQKTTEMKISRLKMPLAILLLLATTLIYAFIAYVLITYTDASIPYWDAFTTALGIVATWMLAKKILEQWLVWVVVDAVSVGLYIYKDLKPTAILFLVYTVLAVFGYLQWKKQMYLQKNEVI